VIDVVALDGDDTLWHSENQFVMTQDRFRALLADDIDAATLDAKLMDRERQNLALFGYGVKGFTLSMIETAIEVTEGRLDVADIQAIIDGAKEMLQHPVDLLDGVAETVEALVRDHRVMVITKGDLFHQESKLARSGLAELFWQVEIVAEKDVATYRRIFDRYAIDPATFVWEMEHAEGDPDLDGYWELDTIRDLPELIARL
jgi:putative hydrolase of the HAD superfamily